MAGRGRPKHPRPEGWGKEFVLQWLEFHPGGNILPFLERLAKDIQGCQGGTLYQEIARWRRTDPDFRDKYRELMGGRHHAVGNSYAELLSLEHREGMENWKLEAAVAYLTSRSKTTAAAAVGISVSHLYGKLKQGNPAFDEHLAHLFQQVETMMLWSKEEVLEWAVGEAQAQGDARTAGQLSLAVLERLDKTKWSKSEEVRHSGTVVHEHVLKERQDRAVESAGVTSRRLFGPREPVAALPEHREPVEILDAEYVEEEALAAEG